MTETKILAIANRKGGVGKTTTAVTLAHGLARRLQENGGGYVLLIDLDPQSNAATCLGLRPEKGDVADVLLGEKSVKEVVMSAGEHRPGLYLLPSSDNLSSAKAEIIASEASNAAIAHITGRKAKKSNGVNGLLNDRLSLAKQVFRYIILDCPPSLDIFTAAVYNFADAAVVPVKMDFLGATGTRQHTNNIIEVQAEGIDIHIEVVVPTFFRKQERLPKEMLTALVKFYGRSRVAEPIPQAAVLERAPAIGGQTIWEYAPDSVAALAYSKLVDRIYKG